MKVTFHKVAKYFLVLYWHLFPKLRMFCNYFFFNYVFKLICNSTKLSTVTLAKSSQNGQKKKFKELKDQVTWL